MGYGGALIWTGLASNLKREFRDKKIVFIYKTNIKDLLFFTKNSDFQIYENNPDIHLVTNKFCWFFIKFLKNKKDLFLIDLENEKYHYWIKDEPTKMIYRQGGHAIEIACHPFNLKKVELKTKLDLTKSEKNTAHSLIMENNLVEKQYICVEPNAKKLFTANKQWPFSYWQTLITKINILIEEKKLNYKIVQIGVKDGLKLDGVIDLTGKTEFRILKEILDKSIFIMANEGGIGHLSTSTETKALIISNPSLPKNLMQYPQNINIFPEDGIHNCGSKKECEICQKLLNSISPESVFEQVVKFLES